VCAEAASFDLTETELSETITTVRKMMDGGNLEQGAHELCADLLER
jgi:hypothetical protein